MVLIIHRYFRALTVKFSPNPFTTQKIANLEDSETSNSSFLATLMVLNIKRVFFLDLTGKFPLISITNRKMAYLKMLSHASKSLRPKLWPLCTILSCTRESFLSAIPVNFLLTPLLPKRWQICKILRHLQIIVFSWS